MLSEAQLDLHFTDAVQHTTTAYRRTLLTENEEEVQES